MPLTLRSRRTRIGLALALLLLGGAAAWASVRPSNDRRWVVDQVVLPRAEFDGSTVRIRHVRNFRYGPDESPTPGYDERTLDLDKIESVWFALAPFSTDWRGPAHSFLSFGFADSQYVAISVEARKEPGESYSILKGMLKRFEIMYVIGDERDLIGLRTNIRGDELYLYPVRAPRERIRSLFVEMLQRANALHDAPEFYNTVTNNCTTNIVRHVNHVAERKVPYGWRVLLPGYADELALDLGLVDTELPLEEARRAFRVNERARRYADRPDFSVRIRDRAEPGDTARRAPPVAEGVAPPRAG